MRGIIVAILLLLTGCETTSSVPAALPGSLTYGGKVIHSPYRPGSIVKNTFLDEFGYRIFERYIVQPDGTLRLTSQITSPDLLWD